MKKILILFLLSFPIIIFTIVTLTSTIIAYSVPLAVEGIKIVGSADINDANVGTPHDLKFEILPHDARDLSFDIIDENGNVLVDYNQGGKVTHNNQETHIVEITSKTSDNSILIENGVITLQLKTTNIGFTSLRITTKDGNYSVTSDVMVLDPNKDPAEIQGIVLDYNKSNEDMLFGNKNEIEVGFTYFPKEAIKVDASINDEDFKESEEFKTITNEIKQNALQLEGEFRRTRIDITDFNISDEVNGRGSITIQSTQSNTVGIMSLSITIDDRLSRYDFNIDHGYNITKGDQLFDYKDKKDDNSETINFYLLDHIFIDETIVFEESTKLYGNHFKIDHSSLKEYTEVDKDGKILNINKKAITFTSNNSGLYQTHVVGKLNRELGQPYENIVNVSMDAKSASVKWMEIKDVKIDYGRYNLSLRGRVGSLNDTPTVFNVDNVTLYGAFLASLEIDNHRLANTDTYATKVNLSRLYVSYTAISVLLQNNRKGTVPGSILNLIEKDGVKAINSNSWRNLDDASGALSAENFGYILKELKSNEYKDVYHKDGKDYHVNPVIMIRGGSENISKIIFEANSEGIVDKTMDDLIRKERKPKGLIEIGITGGVDPFVIYLLNPEFYKKEGDNY